MKKRTIIDLPDEDLKRLDSLAEANSIPRAAVLREAIREYVTRKGQVPLPLKPLEGFGSLKGYYGDGQVWQDKMREEWE